MALDVTDLPRDKNGVIQGVWRILHVDPGFSGAVGVVPMSDGQSQRPVWGRELQVLAACYGPHLCIEPWGEDLPPHFVAGPLVMHRLPDDFGWTPEPCPWRQASETAEEPVRIEPESADVIWPKKPDEPAEPFDVENATLDELRAHCDENDIKYDGRWGERKLRRAIRAHSA